jgi:Domain of unknown function (DUF5666)
MPGINNCLSQIYTAAQIDDYPIAALRIQRMLQNLAFLVGDAMSRFGLRISAEVALSTLILMGLAKGQVTPAQSIVSSPAEVSSSSLSSNAADAPAEGADIALDPASLLPDLPSLPKAKASLVGGTIARMDRVRDQLTVQVFGGGKMKVAFDTRTHIFHDGAEAQASDLRPGDRVYVDTILDGSTVFARSIRLKTSASAGESQGIVVSYRTDTGELLVRDAISPRPLKIHLTSSTRLVHGDKTVSTGELIPGTLIAIKFGMKDGLDLAREISVLAVPGNNFTFAGRVTAVDLRLGLLVINSATDGKTYEISFDPSALGVDDRLRPSADVSVLTRFDGSRYIAQNVTVTSQEP